MTEPFVTDIERARTALTTDIRRQGWPKILHAIRLYRSMRKAFPKIEDKRTMWKLSRRISKGHVNHFPAAAEVILPRGEMYRISWGTQMTIARIR